MKSVHKFTRRFLLSALLFVVALIMSVSSGCTFDAEHNKAHWESFENDVHQAHKFIDEHFFHYDWEDPDVWYIEDRP